MIQELLVGILISLKHFLGRCARENCIYNVFSVVECLQRQYTKREVTFYDSLSLFNDISIFELDVLKGV